MKKRTQNYYILIKLTHKKLYVFKNKSFDCANDSIGQE